MADTVVQPSQFFELSVLRLSPEVCGPGRRTLNSNLRCMIRLKEFETDMVEVPPFKFTSSEDEELCKTILKKVMPYDTHDYQLSAITHLLDGIDVLLVTATGTGKTDTFIRLMHVIRALSEDRMHTERFPRDPVMLVVCPTKALEYDMVRGQLGT
jgi:ATP-dependent helicase YprA (DUF1998 family)